MIGRLQHRTLTTGRCALLLSTAMAAAVTACSSGVPADSGAAHQMYPRQDLEAFMNETSEVPPGTGEYRIGVGDVLDVIFLYHSNLNTRNVPVRRDGRISVPYVGDAMAAGLTPMELDSVLTNRFSEILRDPTLSVIVREEAERIVYVLGEVETPGGFPYKDRISLVQSIAEAGGVLESAKPAHVVVIRREGLNKIVGVEVDVSSILRGEAIQNDLPLKKYDIVYVPKSAIYTVAEFAEQVNIIMRPFLTGWQLRTLEANYEFFNARNTVTVE